MILKRVWVILIIFIIAVATTAIVSFRVTKIYEASSVINAIASESIDMGATVVQLAPAAIELLPRVENADAITGLSFSLLSTKPELSKVKGHIELEGVYLRRIPRD